METYGVNRNKHIGVQYVKDRESCVYPTESLARYRTIRFKCAVSWYFLNHDFTHQAQHARLQ